MTAEPLIVSRNNIKTSWSEEKNEQIIHPIQSHSTAAFTREVVSHPGKKYVISVSLVLTAVNH